MKTIELLSTSFKFMHHNAKSLCFVNWIFLGRAIVNKKEHPSVYRVTVIQDGKQVGDVFTTSLQCNITNSTDFLKRAIN
jgi:hypothetical protein